MCVYNLSIDLISINSTPNLPIITERHRPIQSIRINRTYDGMMEIHTTRNTETPEPFVTDQVGGRYPGSVSILCGRPFGHGFYLVFAEASDIVS